MKTPAPQRPAATSPSARWLELLPLVAATTMLLLGLDGTHKCAPSDAPIPGPCAVAAA